MPIPSQESQRRAEIGSAEEPITTECTPSGASGGRHLEKLKKMVYHVRPAAGVTSDVGLLPTFRARISVPGGRKNKVRDVRVLVDTGAQISLCPVNLAKDVGAHIIPIEVHLGSVGTTATQRLDGACVVEIRSLHTDYVLSATVVLIPQLSGRSRSAALNPYERYPSAALALGSPLADTWPQPKGAKIDIILGQDNIWPILKAEPFWPTEASDRGPIFLDTPFGVIIQGQVATGTVLHTTADVRDADWSALQTSLAIPGSKGTSERELKEPLLEKLLDRLWCLDSIGIKTPPETGLNSKQQYAVTYLEENLEYLADIKKFRVKLPMDKKKDPLVNNRYSAQGRLDSLMTHLERLPLKKDLYAKAMDKYLDKQHCTLVTEADERYDQIFYLPHSGVLEPIPGTDEVKLRIVFDCSAKDRNGNSLNDCLVTGPVPDASIPRILTTWRNGKFAFNMDVKECFLNILLHEDQQNLFRFLWYPNAERRREPVTYKFTSLIFGSTCSPWVSSTCLWKLLELNQEHHPKVVEMTKRGLWVDDILLSADDLGQAQKTIRTLEEIFATGSFKLAKFVSSHDGVLKDVDESQLLFARDQKPRGKVKALGVDWDLDEDTLSVDRELEPAFQKHKKRGSGKEYHTKRTLSRMIATVFDPLQILAPWKVGGSLLLKKAWVYHNKLAEDKGISKTAKYLWDEPLPDDLEAEIDEWAKDHTLVKDIAIPRCLKRDGEVKRQEIWGFCDASPLAYGCVVYLRTIYAKGPATSRFVLARTKINPPRQPLTLPRAELVAARFLATAVLAVKEYLLMGKDTKTYLFGDSMIALHWLKQDPEKWKVFVSNAVTVIQGASKVDDWYHIPGEDNPADLLTRPHTLEDLKGEMGQLWFHGPEFILTGNVPPQPDFSVERPVEVETELKRQAEEELTVGLASVKPKDSPIATVFGRTSDTLRAIRIVAWMVRAITPCRGSGGPDQAVGRAKGKVLVLSQPDIDRAMDAIARHIQRTEFTGVIDDLRRSGEVKATDRLAGLNPYLDERGLLRSKSRVEADGQGVISKDWAEPIIMPSSSEILGRLILWTHEKYLHAGTDLVHATLRSKWWIVRGRATIQKYLTRCMECKKQRGKLSQQQMAPLPPERTALSEDPFTHIAIDGLGPVIVQVPKRGDEASTEEDRAATRKRKAFVSAKRWLLVICCMTTRAVNIEVLENLYAESFVHALRRHFAAYGMAKSVRLDNLRAHVKMSRELNALLKKTYIYDIHQAAKRLGLAWSWSAVGEPSTNGVVERCVRMVKECLIKTAGKHSMSHAQLTTFAREATAIVNSRPLAQVHQGSTDDCMAVTPNHLLHGRAFIQLPLGTEHMDRRAKDVQQMWRERQRATREFWILFQDQYINSILERKKWKKETEPVRVGDLCLVHEPGRKRRDWPLGVVDQLITNRQDGLARSVRVRMADKTVARSIRSLVFLRHLEDYVPSPGHKGFTHVERDPERDDKMKFVKTPAKEDDEKEPPEDPIEMAEEDLPERPEQPDPPLDDDIDDETPLATYRKTKQKKTKPKGTRDVDEKGATPAPRTEEHGRPRTRLQAKLEAERARH